MSLAPLTTRPDRSWDLPGFHFRVEHALSRFLGQQERVLAGVGPELTPVLDVLREFVLGGGKRVRPAFCYWGWRGAGGEPADDGILVAAAALELLQACALLHDDIMDGSDVRRGRPSAHRRFADRHQAAGLRGSAAHFGTSVAILLGDLCLTWCAQMFDSCGLPSSAVSAARPVFHEMHTEVMAGQYLDLLAQAHGGGSCRRARRIIRYKTAKYTVERPLELGALLAGADHALKRRYAAYARPVGEAFQLRDDVLGVFGSPAETGKPAGDDLREGKPTLMVELTRRHATTAQVARFDALFGRPGLDGQEVEELREIIRAAGALAAVEALIEQHTAAALERLTGGSLPEEAREALADLAIAAANRRG